MFQGTFEHTIDDKNRVNVPVDFREELRTLGDERLYITNFNFLRTRCLDVFPYAAWLELQERLRQKPQFDPNVMVFQHYYVGGAQPISVDKQGRVLIPQRLREYAGLKKEVAFVGMSDKFRLWDRDAWATVFAAGEQSLIDNPAMLGGLGI